MTNLAPGQEADRLAKPIVC